MNLCGNRPQFQHDNAPIHASRATKEWLKQKNIDIIEWPARSPDLNPIENAWSQLSRQVYKNGRQFRNIEQLKNCIEIEWNNLDQTKIQGLIISMKDRLIEVISKNSSNTHY